MKADAPTDSLLDNDSRKFWKNVYTISSHVVASNLFNVNGAIIPGSRNVREMRKDYFQELYTSKHGSNSSIGTFW